MAFILSPDFFHCIEEHRASLLRAIQRSERQNPEVKKIKQEPITSSQVVAAIDKIVQEVLESLSKDEAPVLTVENRSNWTNVEFTDSVGLQMAKNCATRKVRSNRPKSAQRFALTMKILSVIYKLVQTNTYATKRDIFYENVQLYGSQTTVDSIVMDISCMLKVPRRSLHILSTSKGCVAGNLLYIEQDGTKVDCNFNTSGVLVPSNVEGVTNLRTAARFVLIIEKDATFQRLLDDDFCGMCGPCILITGKGVPDLNTRLFVRKLWDTFQIPIFTLVDADPHGIEIMCIYKYGSLVTRPCRGADTLICTGPKKVAEFTEEAVCFLPTSVEARGARQNKAFRALLIRIETTKLEIMTSRKMKAEIQVLTSLSPTFLTSIYLPNKLQYGGWI